MLADAVIILVRDIQNAQQMTLQAHQALCISIAIVLVNVLIARKGQVDHVSIYK